MQEIIGWIGAFLYIIAYFLVSIKKLKADHLNFQLLNISGGRMFDRQFIAPVRLSKPFLRTAYAAIGVFAIYYNRRK